MIGPDRQHNAEPDHHNEEGSFVLFLGTAVSKKEATRGNGRLRRRPTVKLGLSVGRLRNSLNWESSRNNRGPFAPYRFQLENRGAPTCARREARPRTTAVRCSDYCISLFSPPVQYLRHADAFYASR